MESRDVDQSSNGSDASTEKIEPPSRADIAISAVTDVSYAMAQCRIPAIDHITVWNHGADHHGAVVEVEVVGADCLLAGPREIHLDLAAAKQTVIRAIDLKLDPAAMLKVTEQRPGQIRVVLRDGDGTVLAEASRDVNILASNQWKATPPQLALELLAAYVQPNSASVTALMPAVSDRLAELTGDSSIDGYQSDSPERVDAIAQAVFDAIRARDIRYAEPPAGWGIDGQKVRTPAEVLDGRLATALDATLTMAAALEQAGINTTLWILNGVSFLGYWRTDSALDPVSTTEVVEVVNQVDLKHIGLIEATMLTQSVEGVTFDEARRSPFNRHLAAGLGEVIGITDVKQARLAGILPLPSRAVDDNGNVVVTEYQAQIRSGGPIYEPSASTKPSVDETIPRRIVSWKNALLDLSLRSRLINYTDRAGFRVEAPPAALGRLEDEINAGAALTLLGSDEITSVDSARGIRYGRDLPERDREMLLLEKRSAYIDITSASYKSKLRYLANKARTIVEETGANNLYLAFGMLHWTFNNRELRSPLVLVPVNLVTKNRGERYAVCLDEAGASTPNYCLIEKLRVSFGLEIPDLANPAEDASGIDLAGTFAGVRQAMVDAGLPFRVEESVHLSILQFAKFPLWKDLDDSWEELSRNRLVKHLVETPLEKFVDPVGELPSVDLDELATQLPIPADSSQLRAVIGAVGGQTFVLEGPPGTGKSQTITNLLAHAMASGRRVLFVAEKRAALDVVKKRLEAVGLSRLSLDLHDKSARPAAVRGQIAEALDFHLAYDQDLMRTQRQIADSSRRSLASYAERLHEPNAAGQSLYSARTRELASAQDITPIDVPLQLVSGGSTEKFRALETLFCELPELAYRARPESNHPWGFLDRLPRDGFDVSSIHQAATEFDRALEAVENSGVSVAAMNPIRTAAELITWSRVAAEPRVPIVELDALYTATGRFQAEEITEAVAALNNSQPSWLAICSPEVIDLDVAGVHEAAQAADQSGFFGRKKRRRAARALLNDALTVDPTTVPLKTLSALTADLVTAQAAAADLRNKVAALPVTAFDGSWNPFVAEDRQHLADFLTIRQRLAETLSIRPTDPFVGAMREHYSQSSQGASAQELGRLAAAWERFTSVTGFSYDDQQRWKGDTHLFQWWIQTRPARRLQTPDTIEAWTALIAHLEPLRRYGMDSSRDGILAGRIPAEEAGLAFDLGVAKASVKERLEASGLSGFDIAAHGKSIERFTSSARNIRDELRRAIPADLLKARAFDTNQAAGQIGGLRRQLERKRGGMSVRALIENYGDLITQILPCTLMSPDSVARFFPAKQGIFDIVVFDEASQIRVADAIGAMGRANSVVVVGDSKQMPPTSFAEASASTDDDEEYGADVVVDEESILTECVNAQVPQQLLSWHYRSQDEVLIAFSNLNYYRGRLASFPAPLGAGSGHGISFVRLNGHFQREGRGKELRTNRIEAERIVEDIRRRFAESPDHAPSLGVITFNAPQRDLIDNLLRDLGDDRILQALDEPDGLFVKNLENVQGDERDTILFSVAFSKNSRGVLPLNFGPLARPGGERRLNVAITRARREVVLYASFDPSELRAEETAQVGTKHLKAYLDMAQRGVDALTGDGHRQPVIDRHRDEIAAALRESGLTVNTDVGLSDFRVDLEVCDPENPEQPLVAVLLDGEKWAQRRTVADRDGLPVDVLQNLMRWPGVERVWMPEWLTKREDTITRLRDAVTAAKQRLEEPPPEIPSVAEPESALTVAQVEPALPKPPVPVRNHPAIHTYVEWTQRYAGSVEVLDQLHTTWGKERVRAIAVEIIEAEAPIHHGRLTKLVASAFGLGRVNEDRRRAIRRVVPDDYQRGTEPDFYWPAGVHPTGWRTVRLPANGGARALDEVSLTEIGNAMAVVVERSGGIDREELKREALAMFGGRRMTQAIGARLAEALDHAVDRGILMVSASGVVTADSPRV